MKNTLFFFCYFLSAIYCHAHDASLFNVKSYGASGHKHDPATLFIQKALDDCAARGGGTVYFPAGDYLCGSLTLQSNTTIWLEAGATIFGSRNMNDYTRHDAKKGIAGFEYIPSSPVLIYAENAENISIRGKGTIDAQAERVYQPLKNTDDFIAHETVNAQKAGIEMRQYYKVPPATCMIYFIGCSDILVEDVCLRESSGWTLHVQWSEHIVIRGCRIFSDLNAGVNADGIDIDGCRNVCVSDCIIETGDDAIVLKTTSLDGKSEPCENITVTNCILTSTSTALKIGTETYADFRYISFSDCIIRNTNRGMGIIVRDGATVENISFSNIILETNRKHFNWWGNGDAIWLVVKKRNEDSKIGKIDRILFSNITGTSQGTTILEGYSPEHPLGRVTMNQIRLNMLPESLPDKRASHAFWVRYAEEIHLSNVFLRWDVARSEPNWKNLFRFEHITDLVLDRVKGKQLPDNPNPCAVYEHIAHKEEFQCCMN
ncbi:MAG: glycoside hydrolase family 28 protein [Tannerella sp.]|nr:glycoside hydrolase family 28 protein [Tannerella sp.]